MELVVLLVALHYSFQSVPTLAAVSCGIEFSPRGAVRTDDAKIALRAFTVAWAEAEGYGCDKECSAEPRHSDYSKRQLATYNHSSSQSPQIHQFSLLPDTETIAEGFK